MLRKLFTVYMAFLSANVSASTYSCPPVVELDASGLARMLGEVETIDPSLTKKEFEHICMVSTDEGHTIIRIDYPAEQRSSTIGVVPSVTCRATSHEYKWSCRLNEALRLVDGSNYISVDDGVNAHIARKAVEAVNSIITNNLDIFEVDSGEKLNLEEAKHIRRIFYRGGDLYVTVGPKPFYGFDILLKRIQCGLSDCAYRAVSFDFWIS